MTRRPRRAGAKRLRRGTMLGLAALVVLAGAGTAYATVSAPGPLYRLATVTPAQVGATLDVTGTLSPAQQEAVPYPVSGTVATVAVRPGERVTAGQRLGALSKASLRAAVAAAQSTLDQANLQVSNDMAGQDQAAGGAGSGSGSGSGTGRGPGRAALRSRQQAVLRAQRIADRALAQAAAALAQAGLVCRHPAPSPTTTPSSSPTPVPGGTPTTGALPSPAGTPSPASSGSPSPAPTPAGAPGSCARATKRVLAAETVVLHAQQALSRQLAALGAALARATGSSGTGRGGGSGQPAGQAGGSAQPAGTGRSSGPASAAQLAADQATADADGAQLTVAQQDLDNAVVRSPIDGTVVSVAAGPGTAVTAGSTGFEIAGLDSYQVQTEVPVTDLPALKVGQRASVRPDGLAHPLTGSVISIGLIPDTSNSPVTYPVTIGLAGQPAGLHPDGFASVLISTGHSRGVSVPTSAVHYGKHGATVTVYAAGRTRSVKVTVGTKGLVRTRITAGLTAGQQVVLAVLGKPLPTGNAGQGPGIGPGGGAVFIAPG
jgi:multidrug efflux pump subunit AcrA (membrane-fusion protein)